MDEPFDPYRKWLGILPQEQPVNHYRLLGIHLFESDADVIDAAADRQMAHVRTYQTGPHAGESQQILNELSAARICLLDAQKRTAYNLELRAQLAARMREPQGGEMSYGQLLLGAGKYCLAEIKRFWTLRVTLAAAYRAAGVEVYRQSWSRERLAPQFERLDQLGARLESLRQPSGPPPAEPPPAPGVWGRVKSFFGQVMTALRAAGYGWRRRGLLRALGNAAFDLDSACCGSADLTVKIHQDRQHVAQLEAQIAALSTVPKGETVSPKLLAWFILGVVGGVIVLVFLLRLLLLS